MAKGGDSTHAHVHMHWVSFNRHSCSTNCSLTLFFCADFLSIHNVINISNGSCLWYICSIVHLSPAIFAIIATVTHHCSRRARFRHWELEYINCNTTCDACIASISMIFICCIASLYLSSSIACVCDLVDQYTANTINNVVYSFRLPFHFNFTHTNTRTHARPHGHIHQIGNHMYSRVMFFVLFQISFPSNNTLPLCLLITSFHYSCYCYYHHGYHQHTRSLTSNLYFFFHLETNPLVEDAENSKVDYAFDNPAFKGTLWAFLVFFLLLFWSPFILVFLQSDIVMVSFLPCPIRSSILLFFVLQTGCVVYLTLLPLLFLHFVSSHFISFSFSFFFSFSLFFFLRYVLIYVCRRCGFKNCSLSLVECWLGLCI